MENNYTVLKYTVFHSSMTAIYILVSQFRRILFVLFPQICTFISNPASNRYSLRKFSKNKTCTHLVTLAFPFSWCRMKDTSKKNNIFSQFRKNERDKQKLIETVVKQLKSLVNGMSS